MPRIAERTSIDTVIYNRLSDAETHTRTRTHARARTNLDPEGGLLVKRYKISWLVSRGAL